MTKPVKMMECPRCNGTGHLQAFSHVVGGVCFKCAGSKVVPYTVKKKSRYAPINAMHCKSLEEAKTYRMIEFEQRFPELMWVLDDETEALIAGGVGPLKQHVLKLEAKVIEIVGK